MRRSQIVTVDVDVEVDLEDFDTDDLIHELESRGIDYNTKEVDGDANLDILTQIWQLRREGKDYQSELDQLIWNIVGRMA
jgi:hypothetical protein